MSRTQDNQDTIDGLRAAADFLEAHPDLPAFSALVLHYEYGQHARRVLQDFAATCDGPMVEQADTYAVWVETNLSSTVKISASAPLSVVGAKQPAVKYKPILLPSVTARDGLDAATGEGRR